MSAHDSPLVYLDHAATSPLRPEARDAVLAELDNLGNPASLHAAGRRARRTLEESRESVAATLGVRPSEIVFTSGGTEADNLALQGLFWSRNADGSRPRLIISATEHDAVLATARWLATRHGAVVEVVPVDADGRVEVEAIRELLARPDDIAAVSVMWANNETGVLQPVDEIAELCRAAGVPFHSDAVQALGAVPVDLAATPIDLVSATSHKVGGPHGAGVLVVRRGTELSAVLHGGGQERDLRSGTVGVGAIAGLAAAFEIAVKSQSTSFTRLSHLRDRLLAEIAEAVPDIAVNGVGAERLPGIASVRFAGCEGDSLLMLLDARGIQVSTGSACSAGVPQASHVLLAMGLEEDVARSTLRFSLGHSSTESDIDAVVDALPAAVERASSAGRRGRS